MVDFKIVEKSIITKFIVINNTEVELSDILNAITDMLYKTEEDDNYGEHSLRSYELSCSKSAIKILVDLGLVKNYIGSRMANLFCMKDEKALKELYDNLYAIAYSET